MNGMVPDLAAVKSRQNSAWASGNYAVIGSTLQIVGETLCEAIDLRAGERVLDVAGGNGNAALAAARRWADVTCTDYVPALLDCARERGQADGLVMRFEVADAEALPFPDASFDAVLSTFGVMFTPDQERAAAEMIRVCWPGGRIGMANWTPNGFVGQLFKLLGGYLPPPAGVRSPALWGTGARLRELFPGRVIEATPRVFNFRYRSAEHLTEVLRTFYGPVHKAFLALEADRQAALERDMLALMASFDVGGGGPVVVASEYLQVIVRV